MKKLIVSIFMSALGAVSAQADSLMNYIEMPLQVNQLQVFSENSITFKACSSCATVVLKAASQVELLEQGESIDMQHALELHAKQQPENISVFYFRDSLTYNKVLFGSMPGPR